MPSIITRLDVENVKRISAVHIKPDGSTVVIGGANAAGKSSVLDAIMYALAGKRAIPDQPIREGAESAAVELELDDGIVIRRTLTDGGGGTLRITTAEGARFPSAQRWLDQRTAAITFDPFDFARLDPRRQAEQLRALTGVSTEDLDEARGESYAARRETNRRIRDLEAQLRDFPESAEDDPTEEVSVAALVAELQAADLSVDRIDDAQETLERAQQRARDAQTAIDDTEAEIERLRGALDCYRATLAARDAEIETATTAVVEAKEAEIDAEPIREQLGGAEDHNARVRAMQARARHLDLLEEAKMQSQEMSATIAQLDEERAARIAAAEMPVEGLGFGEGGVTFGGVPFDQASAAERLRVSVAMGFAFQPEIRIALVRDASLLDADGLALISELAEAAGGQVWLERVGDGPECDVVIEDGAVREAGSA